METNIQLLKLLPHQWRALNCKKQEFADVCGYGSGKTFGMAVIVLRDLLQYPGIKVGVFAPTFDLLALNNLPLFEKLFEANGIKYDHNKGRKIIKIENGSMIIYRSLDDPTKIVGFEVGRSHIDELDTMPKEKGLDAWRKVKARTRQVFYDADGNVGMNQQGCYTTPEGFNIAYQLFVKEPRQNEDLKGIRQIIKAKSTDNYHLPPGYVAGLISSYPKKLQDAYVNGEFVNLTGGCVYYTFDREAHHLPFDLDRREDERFNEEAQAFLTEPLHIGVDFNVGNMAAIVHRKLPTGGLHAIQEFSKLRDTPDLVEAISELYGRHKLIFYPDASGAHASSNAAESDHMLLSKIGQIRCLPKNPRIKDRVAAFNNLIETGRYFVDIDRCPDLTEDLEQQIYTPYGLPDKTAGKDHRPDAAGYCVNYLHPIVSRKLKLASVAH